MPNKISFWLIPKSPLKEQYQSLIDRLAVEFDAPPFEPHVTLFFGFMRDLQASSEVIEVVCKEFSSIILHAKSIEHSGVFTKTLFVQFQESLVLKELSHRLKSLSKSEDTYVLNPHLSLIYAPLGKEVRDSLSKTILPLSETLEFDEIVAVSCPERVENKEDVLCWKVLSRSKL